MTDHQSKYYTERWRVQERKDQVDQEQNGESHSKQTYRRLDLPGKKQKK